MPIYRTNEKRDGLTKYLIRVNYTQDGQYKTITRIAYGKESAKKFEASMLNSTKEESSDLTVPELIDLYLETKKHEIRESTLKKNAQILNRYIRPLNVKLKKLTSKQLVSWKNDISSRNLSFTMKKNIYGAFRGLLNWAVTVGYLDKNPLIKIGNFRDAYQKKKEILFYTQEEFIKFIREVKVISEERNYNDYYVFFALAYFTGARKGEIHALRWTDYRDGKITISKSISQKLGNGDRETPPKNINSNRTVEVSRPLADILDEHFKQCKQYSGFNESYHICGGLHPLRDTSVENVNKEAAKRAGLHHIRIHDFRHSHASLLANNDINILEISRRLGHSDIATTLNVYSHFYPAEESKATSILDKIRI